MKTFTKQVTNRMNIYVVIVFTSGILSLFLQCLSLVTWGWLQINFDTKTVTPSVNVHSQGTIKVSLWQIELCDEETVNSTINATCATTSKSELGQMLSQMQGESGQQQDGLQDTEARQASIDVVFGDFDILPYLAVMALCSSMFGLAVFLFQFSSCCSKAKIRVGIVSMLFWLIAVGVLVATVSIGGHLNSFLSSLYKMMSSMDLSKNLELPPGVNISLKMSVSFPYSVMLSGIVTSIVRKGQEANDSRKKAYQFADINEPQRGDQPVRSRYGYKLNETKLLTSKRIGLSFDKH